jgi:hypothetical protein
MRTAPSALRRLTLTPPLLCALFAPTHAQVIYTDFSSTNGLIFNGSAAQAGNRLRVAPAANTRTGTVWYNAKQRVRDGFQTVFQFQLSDIGGLGSGDGFAFVIQNSPAGLSAMGGAGAHLGYGFLTNSLAVEFDTYKNGSDPDDNHIGVHTRGKDPNLANEAAAIGRTSNIPRLADGATHTVKIAYTGDELRIYLDDLTNSILNVSTNLTKHGLDRGAAYVGFTAATGDAYQNHDILSWEFYPVTSAVPEPGAWAFLSGLLISGGICLRRRKRR